MVELNLDFNFNIDYAYLDRIFEYYTIKNKVLYLQTPVLPDISQTLVLDETNQDSYLIGLCINAIDTVQTPRTPINNSFFNLRKYQYPILPEAFYDTAFNLPEPVIILIPLQREELDITNWREVNSLFKINLSKKIEAGQQVSIRYASLISVCVMYVYVQYATGKLKQI